MTFSTPSLAARRLLLHTRCLATSLAVKLKGNSTTRLLLASDFSQYTSEQQFAPILRAAGTLQSEANVAVSHLYAEDAARLPAALLRSFDAILFKYSFRTDKDAVLESIRQIGGKAGAATSLIYFDGDDDVCVLWPELLEIVDVYVKKHVFSCLSDYGREFIGKSNLTDYIARQHGTSFAKDIIPTSGPVPEALRGKIQLGWNIGLDDKIVELYARSLPDVALEDREIDVCSRAFCSEALWTYPFRNPITDKLRTLEPDFRVLTPETRVDQEAYYQEMLQSKVCISPFGFGEVCWRDFEAVLCGCVLVKPSMEHMRTNPDIFRANETYVPIRWDLADLEETVRALLKDPDRMERLRKNALAALADYYDGNQFLRDFVRILEKAGLQISLSKQSLRTEANG